MNVITLSLYLLLFGVITFAVMGYSAGSRDWQAPQESEKTQDDVIYEDGHMGIKIDKIEMKS